ncbi:hypothetical protein CEXT_713771 [Caerostris extrusa]|uniref:Secreted protein n=1 Tax=Caerostris extrusa TaxID=172846 RepID=A0AAV4UAY4_CAEEX|nr:hypothetical protein CEXT_713771 [Caerostris extrusa]
MALLSLGKFICLPHPPPGASEVLLLPMLDGWAPISDVCALFSLMIGSSMRPSKHVLTCSFAWRSLPDECWVIAVWTCRNCQGLKRSLDRQRNMSTTTVLSKFVCSAGWAMFSITLR